MTRHRVDPRHPRDLSGRRRSGRGYLTGYEAGLGASPPSGGGGGGGKKGCPLTLLLLPLLLPLLLWRALLALASREPTSGPVGRRGRTRPPEAEQTYERDEMDPLPRKLTADTADHEFEQWREGRR